jgi:PBSX family phage terminase large subunit
LIATPNEVEVGLIEHQYDFLVDDSPWLLSDGGRGSAKTTGLGHKIAWRASHPGSREGLFRQKLIDLRKTTLLTLLEGDGTNPPILAPGTYEHNQTLKTIKIRGGGEIIYNGMDQGDVRRQMGSTGRGSSLNLTGAAFEEWVEMTEANVIQISASVRVKIPGLPLQRYGVCNPGPPSHWLAKRFGLSPGGSPMPRHRRIFADVYANHFLPKEAIEELESLEGVARERYLYGKWVGTDGLVYDKWDRNVHVAEREFEPRRIVVGCDYGHNDPYVLLVIWIDGNNSIHVANEVYESRVSHDEKVGLARDLAGDSEVIVDNSAPELIDSMVRAGIRAVPCKKGAGSVNHGIDLVANMLKLGDNGKPRLTVDPSCVKTIGEFESYEWKPNIDGKLSDTPYDRNNHAMDALRYAVRAIQEESRLFIDTPKRSNATRLQRFMNDD